MAKYPQAVKERSGCKVGWLYFRTKQEADKASRVAQKEGKRKADLGYDFGYQMPGSERWIEADELWEVVIP